MCKQQHLAQGCAGALRPGCQRKGESGTLSPFSVEGLPDAVWTHVKTDQMCVEDGGVGKRGGAATEILLEKAIGSRDSPQLLAEYSCV